MPFKDLSSKITSDSWKKSSRLYALVRDLRLRSVLGPGTFQALRALLERFETPLPVCPLLESLEVDTAEIETEIIFNLFATPTLRHLTITHSSSDPPDEGQTNFFFRRCANTWQHVEHLQFKFAIFPLGATSNIDFGALKNLRFLTIYDISYSSWRTLEGCPKLESVEFVDGEYPDDNPVDISHHFQPPVKLLSLQVFAFNAGTTWSYPAQYMSSLLKGSNMPMLRNITLDLFSFDEPIDILADIISRYPDIEEVKIRQFSGPLMEIVDVLGRLRRIRCLTLVPYDDTALGDDEVDCLTRALGGLEELALRHDNQGDDNIIQMTPGSLLHIAKRCHKLKKLDIDLTLDSLQRYQLLKPNETPAVTLPSVRELHITTMDFSHKMLPGFAAFLAAMFPNVQTLSVARDKFHSDWEIPYSECKALANAFASARQIRSVEGPSRIEDKRSTFKALARRIGGRT